MLLVLKIVVLFVLFGRTYGIKEVLKETSVNAKVPVPS